MQTRLANSKTEHMRLRGRLKLTLHPPFSARKTSNINQVGIVYQNVALAFSNTWGGGGVDGDGERK